VNAIIPPLAIDGPCLSIRRFGRDPVTARIMIENHTLTEPMLELLSAMVKGRLNILISGGTGAGKTTLLNVLSGYIPNSDRIVTIEDAAELQLKQEHVVRLETRPPNIEGKGAVRQRQLVINSLRMRPDRIVVGEVRGEEAFDMLQAMNTGHEGSLTTVHANTQRDAIARLENMFSMANLNIPERAVRQQLVSAIHAVVQIARLSDGTRKVITISEVVGMENEVILMQDIFVFERVGIDEAGKVRGAFKATGIRPKFAEKLAIAGYRLRPALFESKVEI
jgi:pilus assembly protein CpaF